MHVRPFRLRGDPAEGFKGSPGLQTVVGPAGYDVGGHFDGCQVGGFGLPVFVVDGVVHPVGQDVLDPYVGVGDEGAERGTELRFRDSAVGQDFFVEVCPAFPRVDRCQMCWAAGRDGPLDDRVPGDSGHSDLAVAPVLFAGPFDQVTAGVGFFRRRTW